MWYIEVYPMKTKSQNNRYIDDKEGIALRLPATRFQNFTNTFGRPIIKHQLVLIFEIAVKLFRLTYG